MRGRVVVAAGIAVAVFGMSVGTAAAAQWKKSASGAAEVCFTGEGFDAVALEQAASAAAQWNVVSTNLDVTFGDCSAGANVVPMTVGLRKGDSQFGETEWVESEGQFVSAEITFNEEGITDWAGSIENVVDGNALQQAWLQLFCHEMGHALGLPHVTAKDSCMQTEVGTPFTKPGAGDIATLLEFYGGSAKGDPESTTTIPVTIPATTVPEDGDAGDDGENGDDTSATTVPDESDESDTTGSPIMTIPTIPVLGATSVTTVPDVEDGETSGGDEGDGTTEPEDGDESTTPDTSVPDSGDESTETTPTTDPTKETTDEPTTGVTAKPSSTTTSTKDGKGGKGGKDGKGHATKDGKTTKGKPTDGKSNNVNGKNVNGKSTQGGKKHSCNDKAMSRDQARKMIKSMKQQYKQHEQERKQERKAHQASWSSRR
jgi:hypothetical protein